jgi:hypothetical protein
MTCRGLGRDKDCWGVEGGGGRLELYGWRRFWFWFCFVVLLFSDG